MNWYLAVMRNYVGFAGRARRREYWFFTLFNLLFYSACVFLDFALGSGSSELATSSMPTEGGAVQTMSFAAQSDGIGTFTTLYMLATFLPGVAVLFRRLHDTGRSGWWWLVGLVPVIGAIVLLVFLTEDSQAGSNQYGPNPKSV